MNRSQLAPLGLLIEPEAENLIAISNISLWSRTRVTVTASSSIFAKQVYLLQDNGANGQHNILTPYPPVNYDTYWVLFIYMKNGTNRFAQISVGGEGIFANFDLELGVLGTKHQFVESSIVPAGDGWYRCSMGITSPNGLSFVVYLVMAANAIRAQGNTTSGSIFLCFP